MTINLTVDSGLLEEAQMVDGNLTETETVNRALNEFIQRRKQSRIVELFGTIDYDQDIDEQFQRKIK